jgi:hypothetical protein
MMKMLLKMILNRLLRSQNDFDLALENFALRQQLAIWKRHKKQPQVLTKDRLFWIMLCRSWSNWQEPLIVVKPETVIRWHRKVSSCSGDLSPDKRDLGGLQSPQRFVTLFLR